MSTIKYSLIIPCFNEEKSLNELIRMCEPLGKCRSLEIILVDNGSSDQTQKILERKLKYHSCVRFIRLETNLGYGNGIISGLKEAKGEILGWTHADLQTNPNDFMRAIEIIEKDKVDFVKGRRVSRPFIDSFFTIGMAIFETILLRVVLTDINAQPTVFKKSIIKDWDQPPKDFSLDLYAYFTAKINKRKIGRINVVFEQRKFGSSHWNFSIRSRINFIIRTIKYSLKLKRDLQCK